MRKALLISPVIALLLVVVPVVSAQEEELPGPGITPDSPFYFLDTFGETISMFFAFSDEAKAEKAASIASEKAAEAKAMAEAGNSEAAEKAADRYGDMISIAAENLASVAQSGGDVEAAVAEVVAKATSIHIDVLTQVHDQVPEQAKPAINDALSQSEQGAQSALDSLNGQPDMDELKQEVEEKIEKAKSKRQGIPVDVPNDTESNIPETGQP